MVVTTVSASCKRKDVMGGKKARVEKGILKGEIKTGKGLNQEVSLARAGDMRWGSHHRTIISLLRLFPEVVTVLQYVKEDGDCSQQWTNAKDMTESYGNPRNRKNEFGNRFSEVTSSLIKSMSGLNPSNGFSKFDPSKIFAFAKIYPNDFTTQEIASLLGDTKSFRHTISNDDNFEYFNGISDLACVMVETETHSSYP
ncbi:uncharacterized protein LOC118480189 [Helianthus annuus]|uniref:uncharacterized protein LOC118480189 n=1 Tax=Helianthus annuus TaxID=4232 RepID=UPI001652D74E|nr:uncharacterized protein LOC118480189 [Helianthus annuus]